MDMTGIVSVFAPGVRKSVGSSSAACAELSFHLDGFDCISKGIG